MIAGSLSLVVVGALAVRSALRIHDAPLYICGLFAVGVGIGGLICGAIFPGLMD